MKISCLPVSFFPQLIDGSMKLSEWASIGADLGLDAIDLSIMFLKHHTPTYLKQVKEEIENAGIPVFMITTYPDFTHPSPLQRERELEYLKHDIALASEIGALYLRITAGQDYPETSIENGINWVIEGFRQASPLAQKLKVKLVFENHSKPGAWDRIDFSHRTDVFLKIVELIEDIGISVNFDTANTLVYGDDPIPVLTEVMNRIETIHAADIATKGILKPVILGEGIVPFLDIFSLLRQNKFNGWICIEDASGRGKEGIRKASDFVRKTWEKA